MWQLTKGMVSLISGPDWYTHRREKGPTLSLSVNLAQSGFLSIALGPWASWLHSALRRLEVVQMAACHLKELWELT